MHSPDPSIPILWVCPFAVLLLCIALLPLFARHFWEHRYPLVCFALAVPVIAYFAVIDPHRLRETTFDYLSFIVLLGSL